MRIKRTLLFSLILFLMIFSISFVSANENAVGDVDANELSTLSVSTDIRKHKQDLRYHPKHK